MRIHLGHHFYGAGNLGDDFMLAGFLSAMRELAPQATYTCSVPFALPPLQQRFPEIEWLPYDAAIRARCIAECDAWLGLGGSPFQHALSRWFVDHLEADAAFCEKFRKPVFFLGVGVQTPEELRDAVVQRICAQASAIWTRDAASAERLAALALPSGPLIENAADLAHLFFRTNPPPPAQPGRLAVVANFDYGAWPGQEAFLRVVGATAEPASQLASGFVSSPTSASAPLPPLPRPLTDRVWLAQESRDLPGAERALYAALPPAERARWRLVVPDLEPTPADSLPAALARWPAAEWLVTARFHAAFCGAWSGSSIVILGTNEKLRGVAREFALPLLPVDADEAAVARALRAAASSSSSSSASGSLSPASLPARTRSPLLLAAADRASAACAAFVRTATRSTVAPRPGTP